MHVVHSREIEVKARREQREFDRKLEVQQITEAIRDDVISVIRNSPYTLKDVQARGGPCEKTLIDWWDRKTTQPRLSTVISALIACGHDPSKLLKQYIR